MKPIPGTLHGGGKSFFPPAFTLIELLVVIAIIALLLSIVTPALRKAKAYARNVICRSNLGQWGKIYGAYTSEHKGYFPVGWYGDGSYRDGQWMFALRDYTGTDHEIWCCPHANDPQKCPIDEFGNNVNSFTFTSPWGHITGLQHGGYDTQAHDYGSYGINGFIYGTPENLTRLDPDKYWRKTTVTGVSCSSVPVFADMMWCEMWPEPTDNPVNTEGEWGGYNLSTIAIDRHRNGQVNILMLDFSVKGVELNELWDIKWHRKWQPRKPIWPDWLKEATR